MPVSSASKSTRHAQDPESFDDFFSAVVECGDLPAVMMANALRCNAIEAYLAGVTGPVLDVEVIVGAAATSSNEVWGTSSLSPDALMNASRRLDAWCNEDLPGRYEARFSIVQAILDGRLEFVQDSHGMPADPAVSSITLMIEGLLQESQDYGALHAMCSRILQDVGDLETDRKGQPAVNLLKKLWSELTTLAQRACDQSVEREFVVGLRNAVWNQRMAIVEQVSGARRWFASSFDNDLARSAAASAPNETVVAPSLYGLQPVAIQLLAEEDETRRDSCVDEAVGPDLLGPHDSEWTLPGCNGSTIAALRDVGAGSAGSGLTSVKLTLPGIALPGRVDLSGLPASVEVIEFLGQQPDDAPVTVIVPEHVALVILPLRTSDVRIIETTRTSEPELEPVG